MKKLTIIIPCFNEESGIKKTIEDLLYYKNNIGWDILVIDDGSTDNTPNILSRFSKDISIITHSVNKGYGASLKTGILNTSTDFVAFYDADGQHRPEDLENMFKKISDFDMLIGARGKNSHQDWMRKPGKWVLSKVANYLTNRKIPDLNSGLRVIKREKIVNLLHLFPDGFSFSTTSTIAFMYLSQKVEYYPIQVKKRIGNSTVKQIKHGSSTLLLILRLIVLFNPLKVFLPISFWMIFIGVIYEVIFGIIILYPEVKLIAAAFFMILTGIMIFFFGLIADQISAMRIHDTRNR
ncbi:MAG: glycosyltransferase family 2 protein [Bacteroidota bacterium]